MARDRDKTSKRGEDNKVRAKRILGGATDAIQAVFENIPDEMLAIKHDPKTGKLHTLRIKAGDNKELQKFFYKLNQLDQKHSLWGTADEPFLKEEGHKDYYLIRYVETFIKEMNTKIDEKKGLKNKDQLKQNIASLAELVETKSPRNRYANPKDPGKKPPKKSATPTVSITKAKGASSKGPLTPEQATLEKNRIYDALITQYPKYITANNDKSLIYYKYNTNDEVKIDLTDASEPSITGKIGSAEFAQSLIAVFDRGTEISITFDFTADDFETTHETVNELTQRTLTALRARLGDDGPKITTCNYTYEYEDGKRRGGTFDEDKFKEEKVKDPNEIHPITFEEQMGFMERFYNKKLLPEDKKRVDAINELRQQQKVHFHEDFFDEENDDPLQCARDFTRIGYKPTANTRLSSTDDLAPGHSPSTTQRRQFSRYKLVAGPVNYYLNGKDGEPTTIHTITACAINLMGSSPADIRRFTTNHREGQLNDREGILNKKEYEKECKKIARFIVSSAKKDGATHFVMPAFGVGVYIKKLTPQSKTKAKECMYKAFAQAAKEERITIDWVVYSESDTAQEELQELQEYTDKDAKIKPVIAEIKGYTKNLIEQGKPGEIFKLTAGSDRTIGGKFNDPKAKTEEEDSAKVSDALPVQSNTKNDVIDQEIETEIKLHQQFSPENAFTMFR